MVALLLNSDGIWVAALPNRLIVKRMIRSYCQAECSNYVDNFTFYTHAYAYNYLNG